MSVPIISPATSVLGFAMYEQIIFQPAATGSGITWSCPGLPTGVTINSATGRISGAATEPGVYDCVLKATNTDGSGTLAITIGIESQPYLNDDGIEINIDLATGGVSFPNGLPVFKKGDQVPFLVGYTKRQQLIDLPVMTLVCGIKQNDPEATLILSDGNFVKIGAYETTRWKIILELTASVLEAVLSDYDDDQGTGFYGRFEIQAAIQQTDTAFSQTELRRTSQTFALAIYRDEVPDA